MQFSDGENFIQLEKALSNKFEIGGTVWCIGTFGSANLTNKNLPWKIGTVCIQNSNEKELEKMTTDLLLWIEENGYMLISDNST